MDNNPIDFKGMTINERLGVSGKFQGWDDAIKNKDIDKITKILSEIGLNEQEIQWTVQTIKKDW